MWLKSHSELRDHPKVKKAARLLKTSVPAIVGHLHMLWWWCLSYAQDGVISDYDAEDISDAVMFDGDPNEFIEILISCRLLDRDENVIISVHDWAEHYGQIVEKREREAERLRDFRAKKARNADETRTNDVDKIRRDKNRKEEIRKEEIIKNKDTPLPPASGGSPPQGGPGVGVSNGDKSPKKTKNFRPPTVEEVDDYCRERENGIDASAFIDHYTANGWVTGKAKAPMRDWQAAVRNWEQYRKEQNASCSPPQPPPKEKPPDNPDAALLRKFPNAPPGFNLKKYCLKPDGQIDGELYDNVLRALHGNPNFAEYLPEWAKTQEGANEHD